MEHENAGMLILVPEKKTLKKARGNAEREEEMKERGHASREGPAGTRAQLCKYSTVQYNCVHSTVEDEQT